MAEEQFILLVRLRDNRLLPRLHAGVESKTSASLFSSDTFC